jgi:hypothetical protein
MAELREFQKLEQALIETGRAIEYSRTPSLAARVQAELSGELRRPPQRVRLRPVLLVALSIIAVLALLLIIPETREAIAQLLGLRTIRIIQATPAPLPRQQSPATATIALATPAPTSTPGIAPFKQCCPATLKEAQQKARFRILLPPDEPPSQVFFQDQAFGRGSEPQQAVLVFGSPQSPRYVLYQASRVLYEKIISGSEANAGTVISETLVNGQRALWLTGAPHVLITLDRSGEPVLRTERPVTANTLIWETGDLDTGVTYRLETAQSLEEAIRFAESLH